jgi:hypothetical protein
LTESRAVTGPFGVLGSEDFGHFDVLRRATALNATVPYEPGVEAEPRLWVAATFDELRHAI